MLRRQFNIKCFSACKAFVIVVLVIIIAYEIYKEYRCDSSYELGRSMYLVGDYATAENIFKCLSDRNEEAAYALGLMHLEGKGVSKDQALANYYFRKGAGLGSSLSMYALYKIEIDSEKRYWLEMSAKAGNSKALLEMYFSGYYFNGIEISKKNKIDVLNLAVMYGSVTAKTFLALETNSNSPEYREAYDTLLSAENGNPSAYYKLAVMYFNGVYFDQNYRLSEKYFDKALLNGYERASVYLSYMHLYGFGVGQNCIEYSRLYYFSDDVVLKKKLGLLDKDKSDRECAMMEFRGNG